MHESSNTPECGMSQIGMCHATHINVSCHTYACGTSRTHLLCGAHLQKKPRDSAKPHVFLCGRNFRALLANRIGCFIISTPRGVGCPKIANSRLQKGPNILFRQRASPHSTLRWEAIARIFIYTHTRTNTRVLVAWVLVAFPPHAHARKTAHAARISIYNLLRMLFAPASAILRTCCVHQALQSSWHDHLQSSFLSSLNITFYFRTCNIWVGFFSINKGNHFSWASLLLYWMRRRVRRQFVEVSLCEPAESYFAVMKVTSLVRR